MLNIPERPWNDADISFLTNNAASLPEEIRDELGIAPVVPDNDFKADYDSATDPIIEPEVVVPEVVVEEVIPEVVTEEEVLVTTDEVVDNQDTDNA